MTRSQAWFAPHPGKLVASALALVCLGCASRPKAVAPAADAKASQAQSAGPRYAPSPDPGLSDPVPAAQEAAKIPFPRFAVPVSQDRPQLGPQDAPVTVVIFSDFECPYCAKAQRTLDELDKAFPGKIRRIYRAFPLSGHPNAMLAALMAESAHAQGRFWPFYRALFSGVALDPNTLWDIAQDSGLNMETLAQDLQSLVHAKQVDQDLELAADLGVQATPVFFVNGRRITGSAPFPVFAHYIEQETGLVSQLDLAKGPAYQQLTQHGYTGIQREKTAPTRVELSSQGAPVRGPANAPITVVTFADFECPYCVRGHQALTRALSQFPDDVRVVFRHLPLPFHRQGQKAARLGVLAQRQDKFWALHDALYAHGNTLSDDALRRIAIEVGLDKAQIESALSNTDETLSRRVQEDLDLAKKLGIRGTPAYVINGIVKQGAQPELNLRLSFRRELETTKAND